MEVHPCSQKQKYWLTAMVNPQPLTVAGFEGLYKDILDNET